MWWAIPLGLLGLVIWFIVPFAIELTAQRIKEEKYMLKNYNEILEMRDEGLCESCDYGYDRCMADGKAFCKRCKEEQLNAEQEESV